MISQLDLFGFRYFHFANKENQWVDLLILWL